MSKACNVGKCVDFPDRLVQILSRKFWTICPQPKLDLDYSWTSKNLDSDLHLYSVPTTAWGGGGGSDPTPLLSKKRMVAVSEKWFRDLIQRNFLANGRTIFFRCIPKHVFFWKQWNKSYNTSLTYERDIVCVVFYSLITAGRTWCLTAPLPGSALSVRASMLGLWVVWAYT